MRKARRPTFLDEIPSNLPQSDMRPIREEKYRQPARMYPEGAPITVERVQDAMKALAYVMISRTDGDIFTPLWERPERDLADLKTRRQAVERARSFLKSFDPHEVSKLLHIDPAKLPA